MSCQTSDLLFILDQESEENPTGRIAYFVSPSKGEISSRKSTRQRKAWPAF